MKKRERSSNFTEGEKELLLEIVRKYFHVLENKKTDGTTVKKKAEAWKNVAELFNASSNNVERLPFQLKTAYNNIKKKLKTDSANDKLQMYKIGGGPQIVPKVGESEAHLISLLKPQLEPLKSRFDSAANYIIDDFSNEFIMENADDPSVDVDSTQKVAVLDAAIPNVEVIGLCSNEPQILNPGPSTTTPNSCKRKRTISNVYDNISNYTKEKMKKDNFLTRKADLEMDILLLKKKEIKERNVLRDKEIEILEEKLCQEKFRTKQEEINLQIKQTELSIKMKQLEQM